MSVHVFVNVGHMNVKVEKQGTAICLVQPLSAHKVGYQLQSNKVNFVISE